MINGMTVSLVMPCRNEAGHLAQLVNGLPSFFDEIICVSNSSTDQTVDVGRQIEHDNERFILIEDDRSKGGIGYGFAHMTGIAAAKGDIVVCADSDGTYPVEEVPCILSEMERRHLWLASCSRYPDKNIPLRLQVGVKALNVEIALLYGFVLHDSLSGMWVFKRSISDKLRLTEGDWNLSPQIKINAYKYLGNHFGEVKIVQKSRQGETKQDYFRTGMRHVIWIFKNRFVK